MIRIFFFNNLYLIICNLTSAQHKSFSIHAPKIYNDIIHYILSIDSTSRCKSNLKKFLFFTINTLHLKPENFHK